MEKHNYSGTARLNFFISPKSIFLTCIILLWALSSSNGKFLASSTKSLQLDLNDGNFTLFEHFWQNSGLSPPSHEPCFVQEYLLSKDMKMNLAYVSGLPTDSIKYERIHWLFSLIKYKKTNEHFDFSLLDELMDWMKKLRLLPIFELMGTPENTKDFLLLKRPWYNLCQQTFQHYSHRYGMDYIKQWKIETWNEIDSRQYNVLNFSIKGYLNYVEECFAGIEEVSSSLNKMGPGGVTKRRTAYSDSFLKFCNQNSYRCNLTFITYHQKDYPKTLLNGAMMFRLKLKRKYPNLSSLKLANDEADTKTGWWLPTSWRADVRYAAKMSETVTVFSKFDHLQSLSFDNSFLNELPFTFEQRTLLSRLKINRRLEYSQFFEKPCYTVLGMMNLLGNHLAQVGEHPVYKDITYMLTVDDEQSPNRVSGLITRTNDFDMDETNTTELFSLRIRLPDSWSRAKYYVYTISNVLPHPEKIFKFLKEPVSPNEAERLMIRKAQGPHLVGKGVTTEAVDLHVHLNNPSVTLINICSSSSRFPSQITELQAVNITFNEVLLIWKDFDSNRCVQTYLVEFKLDGTDSFKKISLNDNFFCHFHYAVTTGSKEDIYVESNRGTYRVAAVDLWGRQSKFSEVLIY